MFAASDELFTLHSSLGLSFLIRDAVLSPLDLFSNLLCFDRVFETELTKYGIGPSGSEMYCSTFYTNKSRRQEIDNKQEDV